MLPMDSTPMAAAATFTHDGIFERSPPKPSIVSFSLSRKDTAFGTTPSTHCAKDSESGVSMLRTDLITGSSAAKTLCRPLSAGVANISPILAMLERMLAVTPENVSLAPLADSPNVSYMASENVWKSIWPLVTISRTSDWVLPRYSARTDRPLMPRSESCASCSPESLP